MNTWASGYVTDVEYGSGFFKEQAPSHLRLTCLLLGLDSSSIADGFTYCELGCGTGTTSLILAAANPEGRFVAVDFNPAHILHGREMARTAGLDNIEFHECSFEDLAEGRGPRLPPFDFVTLHGVYSWISPGGRAAIVRFLGDALKPGGIVYISYNAMPGWASGLPVQRLLYDLAEHGAERSDRKMWRAVDLLQRLAQSDAAALKDNPFVKKILKVAALSQGSYLVHEYLNRYWQPLYHADVARDLAAAKLSYVGAAGLLGNFPQFMVTPAARAIVDETGDPLLRETLIDMFIDRRFRQDIFIRGRRAMRPAEQQAMLLRLRMTLQVPRADFRLTLSAPAGQANLSPATFLPIADALDKGAHTVRELLEFVAGKADEVMPAAEIVATLVGSGQAVVLKEGVRPDGQAAADRLNRLLLDRIDAVDPNGQIGLAVAAIGSGMPCSFAEALVLRAKMAGADDVVGHAAAEAMRLIGARGERVLKGYEAVEDEAEALGMVRDKVSHVTAGAVMLWQKFLPQLRPVR